MDEIKMWWRTSPAGRVWLVLAVIYFLLRLAAQVYFMLPSQSAAEVGSQMGDDLQLSYVQAARHFAAREDLYLKGSLEHVEEHYLYSPAFAFFFSPHDLAYMNTYIFMALFATFLIDALLKEQTGWASFWLGAVILPIKPHWAFAFLIPLLLGRWRFFARLLAGTLAAYALVTVVTLAVGGFEYGLAQYRDYLAFLVRLVRDYPWWGPDQPFLGYNHSVLQTVYYFLGISQTTFNLALALKLLLLAPLGVLSLRALLKPVKRAGHEVGEAALGLALAFYLAAFIWLDMVWELSLAMTVFVYLWAVVIAPWKKALLGLFFFPYALIDLWRLISYIIWGDAIIYNAGYVLSDPLVYLPVILLVLLVCYSLLLAHLWNWQKATENAL